MTEAADRLLARLEERLNAFEKRLDREIQRIDEKFVDVKDAVNLASSQYPTQAEVAEELQKLRSAGVERRDLDALAKKLDEALVGIETRLAAATQAAALVRAQAIDRTGANG